jgi:5'-methylthioadenosine phosphorylase
MHRLWGGDLIGMTCMPEAKLAREAEIGYALVALVTDYDCWRKTPAAAATGAPAGQAHGEVDPGVLLAEIIANLKAASENAVSLIQRVLSRIAAEPQALLASPALSALKLGIWSDKASIPRDHVEQLAPLWVKYFE